MLSLTEMLLVVALARVMQAMSWNALKQQVRLKGANIEYVLLAGSALFLCIWCTFVLECVCMWDHDSQGKMAF